VQGTNAPSIAYAPPINIQTQHKIMARPIMFNRAFLLIVSIAHLALGLSLSSLASSTVLAISLAPLTLAAAETVDAAVASDARDCKEAGTCNSDDGNVDDTSTDASSDSQVNSEQSNELSSPSQTTGPNGDRLISHEELALHIGKGGASPSNTIWLSILGKVYDVTTGEAYYGAEKGSYRFYAGRDASPCFSTGMNNPDGAEEKLEEWEDKKLVAIYEWSTFYQDHETYKYLGLLAGGKYFDEMGNELPLRQNVVERSSKAMEIMAVEKEKKKKERLAARLAKKEKNKK